MACAPMGLAYVLMAGMESIALWKDVQRGAMVMDSAKPIMSWNGNAGAIRAGLGPVAISLWSKIARIAEITTKTA